MNIEELAAELGKTIKEDKRIAELNAARDAFDADTNLQTWLREYEVQQQALQEQAGQANPDRLLIAKMQGRVDELYKLILNSEVFGRLSDAQSAVNELMESVNNIITYNITGELPQSCSHDCSCCGGDCHH